MEAITKMDLEELRKEIDKIDDEIISNLSRRKNLIEKVAKIKKESNMPVLDEEREQQLLQRLKEKSKENRLDEDFVISLYKIILENSRKEQEDNK